MGVPTSENVISSGRHDPRSLTGRIRNAVLGSKLYGPARALYQILVDRKELNNRIRMKRFYRQFFKKGDLVFDIGANVGEYAEAFASLGAVVVAAEPNPLCCQSLFKLARTSNVRVEGCAVGDVSGTASMRVCEQSHLSTLSDEWFENTHASYKDVRWLDQIQVPVVTLDLLAKRHGVPVFVKIDVEGYEENVIRGMSFLPQFISFEFSNVRRQGALNCIEQLGEKGYEFNPMLGREFSFQFPTWKPAQEATTWLTSYQGQEEFGDILARHRDSARSNTQ